MEIITIAIVALVAVVVGGVSGYMARGRANEDHLKAVQEEARILLDGSKAKGEALVRESELKAKEIRLEAQSEIDGELRSKRDLLREQESQVKLKEEAQSVEAIRLEASLAEIQKGRGDLDSRQQDLQTREVAWQERSNALATKLEELAGLNRDEARSQLIESIESEARLEASKRVLRIEQETKEEADRKAKRLIAMAIQRYAGEYVTERTVSVVHLPNEEMKGRIIGREGRNIRALEAATGIDLIIDDTPEAVILSGFNPLRRQVARVSLERLIADGRIHPSRIEEVVSKVQEELDITVKESGQQAAFDLGLHDVHPELLKLVGQLKYRTSYGQNQYKHAIEVAFLCGMMASELGLDVKVAKRAGLLHDIGKVLGHSMEGSHAVIGAEFAKKYNESKEVVNAMAAHHEEVPKESIYAVLVQASDALSGARPGARREILEGYVRRLEDLENISNSFPGVEKSYAIQAGREVRIVVSNQGVNDAEAIMMSRDIAERIESELTYPGQIKVTVIRETRAIEYAR